VHESHQSPGSGRSGARNPNVPEVNREGKPAMAKPFSREQKEVPSVDAGGVRRTLKRFFRGSERDPAPYVRQHANVLAGHAIAQHPHMYPNNNSYGRGGVNASTPAAHFDPSVQQAYLVEPSAPPANQMSQHALQPQHRDPAAYPGFQQLGFR
jgi:hypothetical protein